MKILIVDDEKDLANLLKINLEVEGYKCSVAYNGVEGIKKIINELPDLVLLDVDMPDINGFKVLEELKKNQQTAHIPVVMCTTIKGDENIKRAHKLGASDYIIKPFETYEIILRIQRLLYNNG